MKRLAIRSVLSTALLALALAGGVRPALAASYNSGPYTASKFDTPGTATTVMTLSTSTFCFLTSVGVEETDVTGERATCRVTRGSVVWQLDAVLGGSSTDADVTCAAICFNN